ncbi:hypothetical protein BSKO_10479 [Bryopsis sp. KO-2023]|nr:hypothetical protein BSKO_10479 [Bryopsis sp. KO-2023]
MASACFPVLRTLDRSVEEILARKFNPADIARADQWRAFRADVGSSGGEQGGFRSFRGRRLCSSPSDGNHKDDSGTPSESLEQFGKRCEEISAYAKMLPAPDKALIRRVQKATLIAKTIHQELGPEQDIRSSISMLQSLGKLATHEELGKIVLDRCSGLILSLMGDFAEEGFSLDCITFCDAFYWFGYLGPRTRRLSSNCDQKIIEILGGAEERLPGMSAIDVGKIMHGLAGLDFRRVEFLGKVDAHAMAEFEAYKIRDLSRVLWAFGKLAYPGSNLFRKVLEYFKGENAIKLRRKEFYPQYVAHLCWAAGKIAKEEDGVHLFDKLIRVAIEDINDFRPEELSQLLTGCHDWSYHPGEDFLNVFCNVFSRDMDRYGLRAVSTCIVLLAHFAYRDLKVLEATRKYILNQNLKPKQRHIFDFTWALSILNGLNELTVDWTLKNTSKLVPDLSAKEKRQFYQFLLSVHVLNPRLSRFLLFPESFEVECYDAWKSLVKSHDYADKVVVDVFRAIRNLGFICVRSEKLVGNRFRVHTVRHKNLNQVFAVEFHRGFKNAPYLVKGPSIWRRRVLQALGFTVLSLDSVQWAKLESVPERREYIKGRIKSLVAAARKTSRVGRGG